jgi:hypothetical protein
LSREQLRVKIKDDCWGRLFPTSTKLKTCEELRGDGGRVREIGDKETEERSIVSSFNDHAKSPFEIMFTVARIFNFEDGFILEPANTLSLNRGASEWRIDKLMATSHLRLSSIFMDDDLPRITILNISSVVTDEEEELTVTTTWDKEEVNGVKIRVSQISR